MNLAPASRPWLGTLRCRGWRLPITARGRRPPALSPAVFRGLGPKPLGKRIFHPLKVKTRLIIKVNNKITALLELAIGRGGRGEPHTPWGAVGGQRVFLQLRLASLKMAAITCSIPLPTSSEWGPLHPTLLAQRTPPAASPGIVSPLLLRDSGTTQLLLLLLGAPKHLLVALELQPVSSSITPTLWPRPCSLAKVSWCLSPSSSPTLGCSKPFPKHRSLVMGEVLLINPVRFYRFSLCQ